MDEIPPYHICQFLTAENESLKSKYDKLKKKYKEIYSEMLALREKLTRFEIDKEYAALDRISKKNEAHVQTKFKENKTNTTTRKFKQDDPIKKLMPLYDGLVKRYEMESKLNKNQAKKLRKIESENEKLQEELFKSNQQNELLEKQLSDKNYLLQNTSIGSKNIRTLQQEYDRKISNLMREKRKLSNENKKLRDELKGLDKSFFDEIEDMKYALQRSTRLNQQYEHVLKHVCKQNGLNYEKTIEFRHSMPSSSGKKKRRQPNTSFNL